MDFQKAIHILNLNPNFTEEELKKAYIKLTKKYHPDKWEGTDKYYDNLRKQQELNEVREYLREYLKHKVTNANNSKKGFSINDYATEKLNSLKKRIEDDGTFSSDEEFKILLKKIDEEIYSFETDAISSYTTAKEGVDSLYAKCMKKIRTELEKYVTSFYQKNYIDESEVKEKVNYDCNLQEFYEQLLKTKEKYGKEIIIKKKLEEETLKYKDYDGYKDIEKLIEVCIKNTFITIKNNGFNYTQKDIDNMHQEILECYQMYHNLKQKIFKLEEVISTIDDKKIKINYSKLVLDFYEGTSLSDIEKRIVEIEKEIEKYKKEKQQKIVFEQNKQEIENIYKSLIDRYSNALKQCNINTNYDDIIYFNDIIKELLTLFRKGYQEFEELDYFKLFNLISFSNKENDCMIIDSIKSDRNSQSKNSLIYIKKYEDYYGQRNSFYIVDTEKMDIGRVRCEKSGNVPKVQYYGHISRDELEEQYISLEEFLNKSIYIGEYRQLLNGNIVELLYQMGEYKLYREEGILCIGQNKTTIKIDYRGKPSIDEFKDKEYVYSQIEKQIIKTIKEASNDYQNFHENGFDDINPDNNNKKRK